MTTKYVLITYDISPKDVEKKKIVELHRKLYGYIDWSQFGKYKYKRNGLLDRFPSMNPSKSVIIVEEKNAKKIINLIKKYTKNIFICKVTLNEKQKRMMKWK